MIGPQQHFLVQIQNTIWKEGDFYRKKHQQLDHGKSMKAPRTFVQSDHTMYDTTSSTLYANGNSSTKEIHAKSPYSTMANRPMNTEGKGMPYESASISDGLNSTLTSPSSSPQNNNTKERLKADMRLITATLKVCFILFAYCLVLVVLSLLYVVCSSGYNLRFL